MDFLPDHALLEVVGGSTFALALVAVDSCEFECVTVPPESWFRSKWCRDAQNGIQRKWRRLVQACQVNLLKS